MLKINKIKKIICSCIILLYAGGTAQNGDQAQDRKSGIGSMKPEECKAVLRAIEAFCNTVEEVLCDLLLLENSGPTSDAVQKVCAASEGFTLCQP